MSCCFFMSFFSFNCMRKVSLLLTALTLSATGFCQSYSLHDFFTYDAALAQKTDRIFDQLNDTARVGQMIIPAAGRLGKPTEHLQQLISKNYIGGILLLNGTKEGFTKMVRSFDTLNRTHKGLPLVYSADAEPSLIGAKIKHTAPVKKANAMVSREEVRKFAAIICKELQEVGIHYNYAPVVDMSPNKVISYRSFGRHPDTAQVWSRIFIEETQRHRIVATAKHFPGHGYVVGDTHKKLVYLDGAMREVDNYIPLIKAGVISIMVAHIAIKNNPEYTTDDLPSSVSRKVVTDLLKQKMKFKGLVVTDAMNMGGVVGIPHCELKAAKAGCDLILMPVHEERALKDILEELQKDDSFRQQIYASVKKIIRLKICLGLI